MNKRRKYLQDKLRRRYGYSTTPTSCRWGTVLTKGDYDYKTKENDNFVNIEIGWLRHGKVVINCFGRKGDKLAGRGSAVITFEELELLYQIAQELKKEWAEFDEECSRKENSNE